MFYVVAFLHIVFCIALVGMILLHSGKGGGLSSSFGGGIGGTFSRTTLQGEKPTGLNGIAGALFALTRIILFFLGLSLQPGRRREGPPALVPTLWGGGVK